MSDQDEYAGMNQTNTRRLRIIAWVVIAVLVLGGGGATVLALLLG